MTVGHNSCLSSLDCGTCHWTFAVIVATIINHRLGKVEIDDQIKNAFSEKLKPLELDIIRLQNNIHFRGCVLTQSYVYAKE